MFAFYIWVTLLSLCITYTASIDAMKGLKKFNKKKYFSIQL